MLITKHPDPSVLESHASALDSTVGLAELLRTQLKAAEETARKIARMAGSDSVALEAETLAVTLDTMRIDDVEKGILWLATNDAEQADAAVERAYPQDDRRVA